MPTELSFELNGHHFAAQAWGNPKSSPILMLHGWLDNSASFAPLAEYIEDFYLVALDLAGHGYSDYRGGNGPYNIWEDVTDIFALADALNWQKFALLGHSRGAMIGLLAAGTFPDRITHLGLIEGLWPEPVDVSQAPQQLAKSIRQVRQQQLKNTSCYASIEQAVEAREGGRFPLSRDAAQLIVERGLKKQGAGFTWSSDPKLFAASAFKLTEAHLQAFVKRIQAPVQVVLANAGLLDMSERFQQGLEHFADIHVTCLDGGHHLHMESEAPQVAAVFQDFFQ